MILITLNGRQKELFDIVWNKVNNININIEVLFIIIIFLFILNCELLINFFYII